MEIRPTVHDLWDSLIYYANYLDNFLFAHESKDYGAHLGALELNLDWLEKYLISFENFFLKVHQTSG